MRLARATEPPSPLVSPVVMVQEAAHDDGTVAFLLAQSLLERQEQRKAQEVPLLAWWTAPRQAGLASCSGVRRNVDGLDAPFAVQTVCLA